MDSQEKKEFEYLKEKYAKNEKILIKAYEKIKRKERELKEANENLQASEEELRASMEEIVTINEELLRKNEIINKQNDKLKNTLRDLKETQLHLLQAEKMASLGILTAGVAHEINNPLNFIMGAYVGLDNYFEKRGLRDEKSITIYLKSLKEGIERATRIVQGLNQFSRDNERYDEDCKIHSIIDNCLAMVHNQIKDRIRIVKRYKKGGILIKGNVGKLHQAFLNILINSSQAIPKNGNITISTELNGKDVVIEIKDNGEGIKEEDLSKITDPFFTTKDPRKGTGLGLSISFSIIKSHKGQLEFNSNPGTGTTVKIKLPLNQI